MTYEGKCPHCGNVVRGGHGTPMKRIDTPVRTCFRCGYKYVDENMYEWAVLDPVYKLWFIFAANNRGLVLLFSLFLGGACLSVDNVETGIGLLVFSALWMAISFVYVKYAHKNAMIASQIRCSDPEYIELLNAIKYDKLANKFDNFYIKEKYKTESKTVFTEEISNKASAPRFCRKCGAELEEGSRFCRKCGTEIKGE